MRTIEETTQYIQDRIDSLDADIKAGDTTRGERVLKGRIVELQWLQEYLKG